MGPLKADGSLREHSSKSAAQLPIISTPSSPATPSTAAAASPTPESEARAVPRIVLTAAPQPQATSAAPQTPAASPMPADGPAEAAACGLQFQGATMPFSQCQSLANDLGADYNVLWNYTPLPSGAGTSQGRLDVAIDAAAKPNSYVGFGIPQQPDAMVGASAVVVKTDAASPSGKAWASGSRTLKRPTSCFYVPCNLFPCNFCMDYPPQGVRGSMSPMRCLTILSNIVISCRNEKSRVCRFLLTNT